MQALGHIIPGLNDVKTVKEQVSQQKSKERAIKQEKAGVGAVLEKRLEKEMESASSLLSINVTYTFQITINAKCTFMLNCLQKYCNIKSFVLL